MQLLHDRWSKAPFFLISLNGSNRVITGMATEEETCSNGTKKFIVGNRCDYIAAALVSDGEKVLRTFQ